MKWLLIGLVMLVALPAAAQTKCTGVLVTLQPAERETIACQWDRTLVSATSDIVKRGVVVQADLTPNSIVAAGPTAAGDKVLITLLPDNGCGSPGCRNGNSYQVSVQATDTDGNKPICDFCLTVKRKVLVP